MKENLIKRESESFVNLRFLQKYLLKTNGFIAGGCFKNIFNNEPIKDIDVFFSDENDFYDAVLVYKNNTDFTKAYSNKNVFAFKEKKTGIVVELIKKTFYDPEDILDDFDFSITKFCYYFEREEDEIGDTTYTYHIIHHQYFFEHLIAKRLVIDSEELIYPFGTFERALRYTKYGYGLCKESKVHLINALRNADKFDEIDLGNSLYDGVD